jgi:hypothetical protein
MTRNEYAKQTRICFLDDRDAVARYVKTHEADTLQKIITIADDVVNQSFLFNLRWDMERTFEPVVFADEIDWLTRAG